MTPSQLSVQLRHIAAKISNSKSPRRDLVARDLKKIIAALDSPVKILNVNYEPGDSRSYGLLEFEAETPYGVLKHKGMIDQSGSIPDFTLTLDGKELDGEVMDLFPDPGLPHKSSPEAVRNRIDVNDAVLKAVEKWCEGYLINNEPGVEFMSKEEINKKHDEYMKNR